MTFRGYIYAIRNTLNDKVYIGQTKDRKQRFATHRKRLRLNSHKSPYLQNAFNKIVDEQAGGDRKAAVKFFEFVTLEEAEYKDATVMTKAERKWIDHYGGLESKDNYNIADPVNPGWHNRKLTPDQVRELISLVADDVSTAELANRFELSAASIGVIVRRSSYEEVEVDSDLSMKAIKVLAARNTKTKLTEELVLKVFRLRKSDLTIQAIQDETGLSYDCVINILSRKTALDVDIPEEYQEVHEYYDQDFFFTDEQVCEIFEMRSQEVLILEIAARFEVVPETISSILARRTYSKVEIDQDILEVTQRLSTKGATHLRKLTDEQVRQVRDMISEGLSQQKTADAFGVSRNLIRDIVRGNTYQHVV